MPDAAIWIVNPTAPCRKMKLRTILFMIHLLSISNGIRLINLRECFLRSVKGDGQRLALISRQILEDPIIGLCRESGHNTQVVHALRLESKSTTLHLLRNGQVQVLILHLKTQLCRLSKADNKCHEDKKNAFHHLVKDFLGNNVAANMVIIGLR